MSQKAQTGNSPGGGPAQVASRGGALARLHLGDLLFQGLAYLAAIIVLAVATAIAAEVIVPARDSIMHFGLGFLVGRTWDPRAQVFGALPFVYGTLLTAAIALLLAFPVGLGIALYLAEQGQAWLKTPLGFAIELLAAIPSVVYGIWALFLLEPVMRDWVEPALGHLSFIPLFAGPQNGASFATAGLVLSIMVLPTIAAISRDVIAAVPPTLREAAYALGATRTETTLGVVLPTATVGIAGAVILALGRALGETMAVTLTIGNRPSITPELFQSGYTLASVIANEFTEAAGKLYLSSLIELGAVLLLVTTLVNVIARVLLVRVGGGVKVRLT